MRDSLYRMGVVIAIVMVLAIASAGAADLAPSPLGDRANPLQTLIRAKWTNSDSAATGGRHYDHIKLFGADYTNLDKLKNGRDQARWIVNHMDMYMWGGEIVRDQPGSASMVWLWQNANIDYVWGWDSLLTEEWLVSEDNDKHYTWDDIVMHYKYDVTTSFYDLCGKTSERATPGWNPDDDTDGSGCIDAGDGDGGRPSDPARTAMCRKESRAAQTYEGCSGDYPTEWLCDVTSDAYVEMTAEVTDRFNKQYKADGFHFDVAAHAAGSGIQLALDKTFQYDGHNVKANDFQYKIDQLYFVPAVMQEYEARAGKETISIANMVSSWFACDGAAGQAAATKYLENVLLETWMETGGTGGLWTTGHRTRNLDCMYKYWLQAGRGVVFTCFDRNPSDRGKLFSLASFYLINHQMAFYYYRTRSHMNPDGEHVENWQWNPWVEFSVGQPVANTLGKTDFQGSDNGSGYFVYETGSGYEILGREYQRKDGQRILVLAKLMAKGQKEGESSTDVTLPRRYLPVMDADGTLGSATATVSMSNNSGLILVEDDDNGR